MVVFRHYLGASRLLTTSTMAEESLNRSGQGYSLRIPSETKGNNAVTFVTHMPPPADTNTRLIAVCGITDTKKEYDRFDFDSDADTLRCHTKERLGRCSQKAEGWFVADFYAFKGPVHEHLCIAGLAPL